ncbi:hypothetical protein EXS65_02165 [Candidatus Peribacteria bacterium]|nr:hypothetical protein [Candidatus Peribacteria bacterium]
MKLPNLPFLILDTETTGFVPKTHRVMEYACVALKNGKIEMEYEQLLSLPEGHEIPGVVQVLTQIRQKDLLGKPTFQEMLPTIKAMLTPETIVVGQNVKFDIGMLKGEGWDISEHPWIDTAMLASIVYPELKSYSLGYMSEALHLMHTPKHRALGDVRATYQLLELCVERLQSLPGSDLDVLKALAERGPESYRRLFASLTSVAKKKRPAWLSLSKHRSPDASDKSIPATMLKGLTKNAIELMQESLCPSTLESILAGAKKGSMIAVKNLDAAVRRVEIPASVVVLPEPQMLLSGEAAEKFLEQKSFTADEMTLAMKLVLYSPKLKIDLPIHGEETAIWNAKIAASAESPEYLARRKALKKDVVLLGHHELISIANGEESAILKGARIVIDDASMLEDTATGALGWTCFVPTLRAAAACNAALTKCTDLIELWVEKLRNGMDLRYIAPSDLGAPEIEHLTVMIEGLLKTELPHAAEKALSDLLLIFQERNLDGRITWVESFLDGNKAIKSVPEKINEVLGRILYDQSEVTLLIPQAAWKECGSVLPLMMKTVDGPVPMLPIPDFSVLLPIGVALDASIVEAKGKTVLLLSSKRAIEELYLKHAEKCEAAGTTFLCQGFSGGQSRMQAEFVLAKEPAILVTTPWTYETMELPRGTIGRLVLQTLPFDHPSHAIFSRRALRYGDPFSEYSLPRLKHRLFRLIRTFVRHMKAGSSFMILDDRLRTKPYGKRVSEYLQNLAPAPTVRPSLAATGQMKLL